MKRVLITAFDRYDQWSDNASWLALVEATKSLPRSPVITTRRYPVDYNELTVRLADDLVADYDVALHIGQAPGANRIALETVGLNVASCTDANPDGYRKLAQDGPDAYMTSLPLASWAAALREAGIPARVSHHAGTYLCNAALYLSQHIAATRDLKTQVLFMHIPLAPTQALQCAETPSMPSSMVVDAVNRLLELIDATPSPGSAQD